MSLPMALRESERIEGQYELRADYLLFEYSVFQVTDASANSWRASSPLCIQNFVSRT